jgi:hypothetical protein
MTVRAAALLIACALIVPACNRDRSLYGGDRERQLLAATTAPDAARVRQLLGAGANPNLMVPYENLYHSPWEIALKQARPGRPEHVAVVQAMLDAKADPRWAYGEHTYKGTVRWYRNPPLTIVRDVPEIVRALMRAGLDPRDAEGALVEAVENQETEIVHILVEAGVDVNTHHGANTPLVAAIETRNVGLMTYLEEHGAREKP